MTFKEFFNKIKPSLDERKKRNILVDFFLHQIIQEINSINDNFPNWQESEINQEYAVNFYECSANVLWDMAVSFAHDSDDKVYDEATDIMQVIRELLQNTVGIEFKPVKIISPTKMMVERGLLEVVEKDSKKLVKLTPAGEEVAESVERQIKASEN